MQTYGINVGHGHCKAVVNDGGRETMMEVFPSQIAHAGDTGELGTAQVVYVDRRPYLVGDDADLGAPITDTTQARLDNPTLIPALVGGGVQRLGITQSGVCVSCLPATWITSQEKKAALGARLREGAAGLFQPTYVISEPHVS